MILSRSSLLITSLTGLIIFGITFVTSADVTKVIPKIINPVSEVIKSDERERIILLELDLLVG